LIKVYIARHGETTWNAERRIQGRSDPDLTPKGYAQGHELFRQLKDRPITAIYTSTRQRAIHTAQPLAEHLGLPILTQSELDEMDYGTYEGKRPADLDDGGKKEFQRYRENRLTFRFPGGESFSEVAARVKSFAERIVREHQGQEILTVAHRGSNRMLIGFLLDYPLEEAVRIEQTNECIYLIERNGHSSVSYFSNGEMREGLLFETAMEVRHPEWAGKGKE